MVLNATFNNISVISSGIDFEKKVPPAMVNKLGTSTSIYIDPM
jgi:hypothetical protein